MEQRTALLVAGGDRMNRIIIIAQAVIILVLAIALLIKVDVINRAVPYYPADKGLVERAIAAYSGSGRKSRTQVDLEVYPVVVHLPSMTCVELNLRPNISGGDTTMCFSRETSRVVGFYQNGD